MCQAVKCNTCGKTTWAGCGNHVDQVMKNVPASDRCTCDQKASVGAGAGGSASTGSGWLGRLFGR
jgi:hypothetical protein